MTNLLVVTNVFADDSIWRKQILSYESFNSNNFGSSLTVNSLVFTKRPFTSYKFTLLSSINELLKKNNSFVAGFG